MTLPPHRMDYSPIIDRPIIKWPNDARVAFWVAPNIEHYEYLPPLSLQMRSLFLAEPKVSLLRRLLVRGVRQALGKGASPRSW